MGQATSECRQWAQKKAGERNHDIETARLQSHHRALEKICGYCQGTPATLAAYGDGDEAVTSNEVEDYLFIVQNS